MTAIKAIPGATSASRFPIRTATACGCLARNRCSPSPRLGPGRCLRHPGFSHPELEAEEAGSPRLAPGASAGRSPLLRVQHPHPDLVRAGGQGSGRGHRADQLPILLHRKRRIPQRHRHHPACALGAECIILRHLSSGAPYLLANATGLPVLNAGDGMHEHPSQALLGPHEPCSPPSAGLRTGPARTLLQGITVAISGRYFALARGPLQRAFIAPGGCPCPAVRPARAAARSGPGTGSRHRHRAGLRSCSPAIAGCDDAAHPEGAAHRRITSTWTSTLARYQLHPEPPARPRAPEAIVMHPGPMIRGLEISQRGGRWAAVGDRRAGTTTACPFAWR